MGDDELEPKRCEFILFAGRYQGDPPEPREYCDGDAIPGSDYCERHRWADEDSQ